MIITPPAETSVPQPLMMSSTEKLGSESSDERNVEDGHCLRIESSRRAKGRKIKKFPPPLSSFNRNSQPSFFLRSVRTDGRLVLTAVRNDRPEILVVSRQNGRLRLHLIREEEKETQILPQVEEEEEEEEEKEEEKIAGWQLKGVSGEVLRRCNEVGIGNHHKLHVWRHHCVPTM